MLKVPVTLWYIFKDTDRGILCYLSLLLNPCPFSPGVWRLRSDWDHGCCYLTDDWRPDVRWEKKNQIQIESLSSCPSFSACLNFLELLMVCLILFRLEIGGTVLVLSCYEAQLATLIYQCCAKNEMLLNTTFSGAALETWATMLRFQKLATCCLMWCCVKSRPQRYVTQYRFLT